MDAARMRALSHAAAAGYRHFDVKHPDYGAKGDGTTDDQPAIQAAIDACHTAGGGTVFLPGGVYLVGGVVDLKEHVSLMGAGNVGWFPDSDAPSILRAAPDFPDSAILRVRAEGDGGAADGGGRVERLLIDGNDQTGSDVQGVAFLGRVHDWVLRDVAIKRCSGEGLIAEWGNDGQPQNITLHRVFSSNHGHEGFAFYGGADLTITDCYSHSNASHGWILDGLVKAEFVCCTSEWNGSDFNKSGFFIGGDSGLLVFHGCRTDRNNGDGFTILTTGAGARRPILLVGCTINRDGRNDGDGGFSRCGIRIAGSSGNLVTPVIITGTAVTAGVDDDDEGTLSPQIAVHVSFAEAVTVDGYFWGEADHVIDGGDNEELIIADTALLRTGDPPAAD